MVSPLSLAYPPVRASRATREALLIPGQSCLQPVRLLLKGRGFNKSSIWLVFNRLRWLYAIKTTGSKFRLSNNHTGYYARVVMAANPELSGFFTLKPLKTPYTPDLVDAREATSSC